MVSCWLFLRFRESVIIHLEFMGYFNIFKFGSKSKEVQWNEIDRRNLIEILTEAQVLLSEYSGGYSGKFYSAEEFYKAFSEELKKVQNSDFPNYDQFYFWFLPTCAFDDFTGMDGIKIANEAYFLLNKWSLSKQKFK